MPDFSWLHSGSTVSWTEIKRFLLEVRFSHRELLWLSSAPTVISILSLIITWRRRAISSAIGRTETVYSLFSRSRGGGRMRWLMMLLAWTSLIIGAAGPRWGPGESDGTSTGRDVVVVLDLSRSMYADDTAVGLRRQSAVSGIRGLLDAMRQKGGHRCALVIFAARPQLLVPLTSDYEHIAYSLNELEEQWKSNTDMQPLEIRPNEESKSGTRIGAALEAAVAAHDKERFQGYQDIILLSDGDDPMDNEEWTHHLNENEWMKGVTAARKAKIPVHTVGIGDPSHDSPVHFGKEWLEVEKSPNVPVQVMTRLYSAKMAAIAEHAHGQYLPAGTQAPELGDFFRKNIEPISARTLEDDSQPQLKDRSAWFLGFGVAFLLIGWILEQ